jgi:hypothetical protein
LHLPRKQLVAMARQRGIQHVLYCTEDGWCLWDNGGERAVTEDELLSELQRPAPAKPEPDHRQGGD